MQRSHDPIPPNDRFLSLHRRLYEPKNQNCQVTPPPAKQLVSFEELIAVGVLQSSARNSRHAVVKIDTNRNMSPPTHAKRATLLPHTLACQATSICCRLFIKIYKTPSVIEMSHLRMLKTPAKGPGDKYSNCAITWHEPRCPRVRKHVNAVDNGKNCSVAVR
jgi:hypothetical protein